MKVLSRLDVSGNRVFVRADLDVPLREAQVTDDQRPAVAKALSGRLTTNAKSDSTNAEQATRLTNLKSTVDYLLSRGVKQIVIAGHIDRPSPRLRDGKPIIDPQLSTKQLLEPLQRILGQQIAFNRDVFLSDSEESQRSFGKPQDDMREQKLILLENLRFWPGEVENDLGFAKKLASLAEIYVNEAFGNCHRNHASMVALPALIPHAAGLHLAEEVEVLTNLLQAAARPFMAIVGGAKIETKLPVIENLSKVADIVLVGGELPLEIQKNGQKFSENVIVGKLTEDTNELSLESTNQFVDKIKNAKTIVWNGPVGKFEEGYVQGTLAIAQTIIDCQAYSVVGGGETTQFLAAHGLISKFSFVSAGGGAMLEFLTGKELPGLKALV